MLDEDKLNARIEKQKQRRQESYERHIVNLKAAPVYRLRECLDAIRVSNRSGSHLNDFRYFPNNTDEHEDMKYAIFKELRKRGHDIFVEPIFTNGARADILDCSEQLIYEVRSTETIEELQEKIRSYPEIFEVVAIDANKKLDINDLRL